MWLVFRTKLEEVKALVEEYEDDGFIIAYIDSDELQEFLISNYIPLEVFTAWGWTSEIDNKDAWDLALELIKKGCRIRSVRISEDKYVYFEIA